MSDLTPTPAPGVYKQKRPRFAGGEIAREEESRETLLRVPAALVEDLRRDQHPKTEEGFCDVFQVCLPYRGLGVWHVGTEDVVADPNQVLFVTADETYRLSGPVGGGYAEVIITPDTEMLHEVACAGRTGLAAHPLFRRRSVPATAALQKLRTRLLAWATTGADYDELEADEVVVLLLSAALQSELPRDSGGSAAAARVVRRTKEHLGAHPSARLRLTDISRAVGTSPAYLTSTFRRVEGVSLHRYLTHVRLARALIELPHATDLTELALDCGFSSHSHFSAVFRRRFGCTPSEFREMARSEGNRIEKF